MGSERNRTSRREFLVGTAAAGAGLLLPRLAFGQGARAPAGIREIALVARETRWELAPGKVVTAMTYNGTVPGPEIRLREGERVRIRFTNQLQEPTTVHWHGLDVPHPMDGVPGLTQPPVPPGGTFLYEFDARPAGTRWYHSHFNEHQQIDRGLSGPIIIDPAGAEGPAYDREVTLVLDDWVTGTGPTIPTTQRGAPGMMGGGHGAGHHGAHGPAAPSGDHAHAYDAFTINGKAYPATGPIRVRRGERLRLRLINASSDHLHTLRLAGHRLLVTHTDGNPLAEPVAVDALPIAPSERYDVLVVADRPGAWLLACTAPGHAHAGEQVALVYPGFETAQAESPPAGGDPLVWRYELGRGRPILPAPTKAERVFQVALSGGMMGSEVWTVNGKRYPETDPLRVGLGDRVRVRFVGQMSPESHPMHLHGQSFAVVAVNGRPLPAPLVKDSVDIEAPAGSVEVEFTAQQLGDWLFHCHKPMHMEGGMAFLVRIG